MKKNKLKCASVKICGLNNQIKFVSSQTARSSITSLLSCVNKSGLKYHLLEKWMKFQTWSSNDKCRTVIWGAIRTDTQQPILNIAFQCSDSPQLTVLLISVMIFAFSGVLSYGKDIPNLMSCWFYAILFLVWSLFIYRL